jgi:gluconate kinase
MDYYDIKKVSSSSLKWFEVSPKYFLKMYLKELDEENKFIYKKGTMVHTYLLEPEVFGKEYVFLDFETPKSQQQKDFCDKVARFKKGNKKEILLRAYRDCYSTKEPDEKVLEKATSLEKQYKDYIKSIKISTIKIVIPKSSDDKLKEITQEIKNHKVASKLIFGDLDNLFEKTEVHNEFQIYWKFMNVECKSMIDRLIIDHENKIIKLVDLKTSSTYDEFDDKLFEYDYNRQLAFYWLAIYNWAKQNNIIIDDYKKETYIVAINMKEPTEVKVYSITDKTLNMGLNSIERIMKELEWHFETNNWDYTRDYYEGDGTIKI